MYFYSNYIPNNVIFDMHDFGSAFSPREVNILQHADENYDRRLEIINNLFKFKEFQKIKKQNQFTDENNINDLIKLIINKFGINASYSTLSMDFGYYLSNENITCIHTRQNKYADIAVYSETKDKIYILAIPSIDNRIGKKHRECQISTALYTIDKKEFSKILDIINLNEKYEKPNKDYKCNEEFVTKHILSHIYDICSGFIDNYQRNGVVRNLLSLPMFEKDKDFNENTNYSIINTNMFLTDNGDDIDVKIDKNKLKYIDFPIYLKKNHLESEKKDIYKFNVNIEICDFNGQRFPETIFKNHIYFKLFIVLISMIVHLQLFNKVDTVLYCNGESIFNSNHIFRDIELRVDDDIMEKNNTTENIYEYIRIIQSFVKIYSELYYNMINIKETI